MKKIISILLIAGLVASISFTSCKKNRGEKPTLPPKESMVQNLKLDGSGNKSASQTNSDTAWTDATIRVGIWNTILFIGLVVPVSSFYKAFEYNATWNNDVDAWVWKYQFGVLLKSYDAELHGKIEGDSAHWKMYVSHDDDFSDFLWYEGWSQLNDLGGRWVMYESPSKTNELLGIYWKKNTLDNTVGITYKNICPPSISPHGANYGGYISYGTMTGTFDRFYNIYNASDTNLTNIEWNFDNENGRIRDHNKYNDIWVCWDAGQQDCDCAK